MCFVHVSYSGVPGLAWYRFPKYSALGTFVFCGYVRTVPSPVIVSYARLLSVPVLFLVSHIVFGLIFTCIVICSILSWGLYAFL